MKVKRGRGRPPGSLNKKTLQRKGLIDASGKPIPQEDTRTDSEILNTIRDRFETYGRYCEGITRNDFPSFICSGSAGIGKSHVALTLLERAQKQGKLRWKYVKGGNLTPLDLYALAFEMSKSGDVILLDDADSIFNDEQGVNLLKALTDSGEERRVSWYSDHPRFKGDDAIPKEFLYQGALLFLTNRNFIREIETSSKESEHFRALLSRAHYLDLTLHSPRAAMLWIDYVVRTNRILVKHHTCQLSDAQQAEALQWLRDNYKNMWDLSIRSAIKLGQLMKLAKGERAQWEHDARAEMLRTDSLGRFKIAAA